MVIIGICVISTVSYHALLRNPTKGWKCGHTLVRRQIDDITRGSYYVII